MKEALGVRIQQVKGQAIPVEGRFTFLYLSNRRQYPTPTGTVPASDPAKYLLTVVEVGG